MTEENKPIYVLSRIDWETGRMDVISASIYPNKTKDAIKQSIENGVISYGNNGKHTCMTDDEKFNLLEADWDDTNMCKVNEHLICGFVDMLVDGKVYQLE